ncbi:MAG: FIST N-terminal domain-containing protein [Candidatus Omnitrophota bacterium]
MPTKIAIGFSRLNDPVAAFKNAAIQVKQQLNSVTVNVVLVFATDAYMSEEGLETLHRILQPERLIGSLTPGILLGNKAEMRGVGILGIMSDDWHFGAAGIDNLNLITTREAGYNLAKILVTDHASPNRNAAICFYDGLRKNNSLICAGMNEGFGLALPVFGGIGLDSDHIRYTRHFYQTRIINDAAVGLLIGGASITAVTSHQSLKPLGKPRIIDNAKENIIRTIDKRPAVNLYENYFLEKGQTLDRNKINAIRMLYPLGIGTMNAREYLIRNPIDFLEDGSIVCQGEIPTGSPVHLMVTDKDICRRNIHDAAVSLHEQLLGKPPGLVLVLESFMRHKAMGNAETPTVSTIRDVLGSAVPIFGMYTLGEIASPGSLKNFHATQLLNASLALLAIG